MYDLLILGGGKGTRLRPETENIPKPLVKIGDKTLIEHQIEYFSLNFVIDRIIITTGYKAEVLEVFCLNKFPKKHIILVREDIEHLSSPGNSIAFAVSGLDQQLCNPLIISFCDYLYKDKISIIGDSIGLFEHSGNDSLPGTYKSYAKIEDNKVVDLLTNSSDTFVNYGFTGLSFIHDIKLLSEIILSNSKLDIRYSQDIILPYIKQRQVLPLKIHSLYNCGEMDDLILTRKKLCK